MAPDRPHWWKKNQELRASMGLPQYEPSRLRDGTYVHEIVKELETAYDCDIELRSDEATYPSRWRIEVDGQPCAEMRRRRDERGNNVYQLSASELRERVKALMGDH